VGSTERARANRNQTVGDRPSHGRELEIQSLKIKKKKEGGKFKNFSKAAEKEFD